jgi:hypothetical protein
MRSLTIYKYMYMYNNLLMTNTHLIEQTPSFPHIIMDIMSRVAETSDCIKMNDATSRSINCPSGSSRKGSERTLNLNWTWVRIDELGLPLYIRNELLYRTIAALESGTKATQIH